MKHRQNHRQHFILLGLAIATASLVILSHLQPVIAHTAKFTDSLHKTGFLSRKKLITATPSPSSSLPNPQTHPLPPTLARWVDPTNAGDYFSEIKLTQLGYLIWSHFPIKIYVERPSTSPDNSASYKRFQNWVNAVLQGVQEWSLYLPLEVVDQPEGADIIIWRSLPPLNISFDEETGKITQLRARSAQTRYEFYLRQVADAPPILAQRFTIQLSPNQGIDYTLATARHEIGHALGIWGHSNLEADTMYLSQVRNPPQISVRDINTLKRIYEQPTRLGWSLMSKSSVQE
jgi:predicted Zn-dependent protease